MNQATLAEQLGIDNLIRPPSDEVDADCHCGSSDRALFHELVPSLPEGGKCSIHIVTQPDDSAIAHYHKILSEVYIFMTAGDGVGIELDGITYAIETPLTRVCIPPGVRHRVRGKAQFIVVVMPGHREPKDDDYFD